MNNSWPYFLLYLIFKLLNWILCFDRVQNEGSYCFIWAPHTYPWLYLGKKKCAWEMTLITFFKCYVSNLNPEFEKILSRDFWKNVIWSFLPYKAESDLRAKSLNKVPFKAPDCQNATNMWFSIEDLRKKMPLVLSNFPSLPQERQKSYLYYKISVLYWK